MNLVEIFERFPSQEDCIAHLEAVRWHNKPVCPYCNSPKTTPLAHRHHCNNCNTSFSVTVGTIFHRTHLPLQKWFLAITLTLNAKKGLSARQLARDIKVTKDTAWRIAMKIRDAMEETKQRILLTGIVEADETYIGGKPRKGGPRGKSQRGRGTRKIPVVGMVERKGRVVADVIKNKSLTHKTLKNLVRKNIDTSKAILMTDQYRGYIGMNQIIEHRTVNHKVWYVDGNNHTNTIESFWAILKRGMVGQYHKVSLNYLPKYITEFSFRYNHRNVDNVFEIIIKRALGV